MDMVVACAGYQDGRRVANLDIGACESFVDGSDRFVWIGLFEPDEQLLRKLQRQFGLHDLAVEDAQCSHQRPKIDIFGDSLFMVLRTARIVEPGLDPVVEFGETHIFAGKGYVITVRHGVTSSYGEVRARAEAAPELLKNGEDYVLYAIMDFAVENYIPIIDAIEKRVEDIEDAVQAEEVGSELIKQIAELRRDLLRVRRITAPVMEICNRLQNFDMPFIDKPVRPYFKDVHNHVIRINESIDILRDMLDGAFDTYILLAANRQGEITRQLAGWAAILAVPTAIAGIYGMNFEYMPELKQEWGYPAVLVVITALCVGLYIKFKTMKWI